MNNLGRRIVTGLIGGAALLFLLSFSYLSFVAVITFIACFSVYEWILICNKQSPGGKLTSLITVVLFWLIIGTVFWCIDYQLENAELWLLVLVFAPLVLFVLFAFLFKWRLKHNLIRIGGIVYISIALVSVIWLSISYNIIKDAGSIHWDNIFLIQIILLIWTNDIGAFFIGKTWGKHALAPKISPKKTIEGFVGGFVLTMIVGFLFAKFPYSENSFTELIATTDWLIMAALISISSTLGDLLESRAKRWAGVKDSSNLLPGHGGFLDRFDAFLLTVPVIFIYICTRILNLI